jgi:hypothetical protein
MSFLTRRVQVLLSDAQYAELEDQARLRDKSVGAVIREAIQEHLQKDDGAERLAAVRRLVAMQLPVADWEQMERESVEHINAE